MALLEQVGLQNRFLRYPYYSVYHAAIQNRDKALLWCSKLSRVGWGRGTLKDCSLSPDRKDSLTTVKEFTLFFFSANPEFESRADSQKLESSPVAKTTHLFSTVWLFLSQQILRNSSIAWQFLARLRWKSLFLISHYPHKFNFLLEPDLPIDSPNAAPIFEI